MVVVLAHIYQQQQVLSCASSWRQGKRTFLIKIINILNLNKNIVKKNLKILKV
jgi:hypothetical protein